LSENNKELQRNIKLSYLRQGGKFILGINSTKEESNKKFFLLKKFLSESGFIKLNNFIDKEINMFSSISMNKNPILFLDTLLKLEIKNNKKYFLSLAPLKLIFLKLKARQFIRESKKEKKKNLRKLSFVSNPKFT